MTVKKMKLGPLPETPADYSHYEEEVIRWDRIGGCAAVVALVVAGIFFGATMTNEPDAVMTMEDVSRLEATAAGPSSEQMFAGEPEEVTIVTPTEAERSVPETTSSGGSVALASADQAGWRLDAEALKPVSKTAPANADGEPEPAPDSNLNSEADTQAELSASPKEPDQLISPVTTLHVGIARAELTDGVRDKEPLDPLGYDVPMNEEGIIKVVLFTEMHDLDGTVLYHDWYRNENRQARVRIPVNVSRQRSHSSKFINRQMLGDWRVKVVDGAGELYAEANFRVN